MTALLALIIDPWYWSVFGSVYTVWVFICPAIPIQLAFIAFFSWLISWCKNPRNYNEKPSKNAME